MVSLTDIGPLRDTVEVRGHTLDVTGITAEGLVFLIDRFPKFRKMLADQGGDLTLEDIKTLGPDIIAAGIACALGKPGDDATEAAAKSLGLGEQMEIVSKALKLTFPKGLAHFMENIQALGVGVASVGGGRGADTKLPSSLNSAFRTVTDSQPGDTHQDSSQDSPN